MKLDSFTRLLLHFTDGSEIRGTFSTIEVVELLNPSRRDVIARGDPVYLQKFDEAPRCEVDGVRHRVMRPQRCGAHLIFRHHLIRAETAGEFEAIWEDTN
jgi:hypothetical protein